VEIFLTFLHVLAAVFLVAVVLLQQGKGADIGSAFGAGASQTVFGSRGAGNFLTKLTTGFVVVFMATSVWLSYYATPRSILNGLDSESQAPAAPPASETKPIAPPASEPRGEQPGAPSGFEVVPPTPDSNKAGAAQGSTPADPSAATPGSSALSEAAHKPASDATGAENRRPATSEAKDSKEKETAAPSAKRAHAPSKPKTDPRKPEDRRARHR
jgi:preprotein translocase subunit SecG